jgi:outer membrane receptor for ferrienterochelin and colicins
MKHRLGIYASAQRIARESYYGAGQSHDAYGRTFDNTVVAGGQYTYAFDKLLFMPSELTGGVEWSYNDLDDHIVRLSRVLRQNTHIVGGFLQNEWKNKKFSLLIGARLDKHNLMDDVVFSPRANVRYSPNDNIGLRLSYSSGYRAPQAYNEDLHVEAVSDKLKIIKLSKGLKPEYSHSFSGSVDLYHTFGRVQTNLLVEGFYTRLNNVFFLERMDEEGAETSDIVYYTRRNGAGAIVQGINLEAKVGMAGVFEVQAGFTIQRSRYTEPENWSDQLTPQKTMFRSPDTYGYFIANANITQAFKASLFGNYTGPMLVQHTFNDADSETVTPRFFDAGAKLSYDFRLSPSTELQLNCGVKNIFDSYQRDIDYGAGKDAAYVYGPMFPRMFFVGAKFSM